MYVNLNLKVIPKILILFLYMGKTYKTDYSGPFQKPIFLRTQRKTMLNLLNLQS